MKLTKCINVRRMGATLFAIMMVLSASAMATADSEPNNDFDGAEYIGTYDSESGTLDYLSDPSDYYEVFLIDGYTITISLTGSGGNFNLYLYDLSESLLDSSTSGGATENIIYSIDDYDDYYIEVRAIDGGGSYTLETEMTYGTPVPSGESFEKATPPSVPWTTGSYAASGGYIDLGTYIDTMIEEMTADMPDDVKVSISGSGGIGQYMLVEYAGPDGANYKFDYSCRLYAAVAVSGKMTANDADMGGGVTVDGSGSGKAEVTADLLYEGSLWLGYYENPAQTNAYWAAEKMTLNIEGSLDLSANVKVDISAEGMSMDGSVDASASADLDMQLTFESTPGIPYMPAMNNDIYLERTCDVSYTGNVMFDMEVDMTATGYFKTMMGDDITIPEPVHYDGSASGTFTDTFSIDYTESTRKATVPALLNGGWGMIMNVDEVGLSDIGGTRAEGFETTATFDPSKGMYTTYDPFLGPAGDIAGSVDTDGMTLKPVSLEDTESFIDDPVAFLKAEGISMPGSSLSGILIILLVVVVIVVVVVVVVLVAKKKTPPQHPQPYQQPVYGQQPGYEQPPPQYPQPQEYPPQGQYPPPPPPSPPGY